MDPTEYYIWRAHLTSGGGLDESKVMGVGALEQPEPAKGQWFCWTKWEPYCPNYLNPRPRTDQINDSFSLVHPAVSYFSSPAYTIMPDHVTIPRAEDLRYGAPTVDGASKFCWWGTICFWQCKEAWGRVVLRGPALLLRSRDYLGPDAKNGAKFVPLEFPGNTRNCLRKGARVKDVPLKGPVARAYDPRAQVAEKRRLGAPLETDAQKRAAKENPEAILCEVRAEDICECRYMGFYARSLGRASDRVNLQNQFVCFDMVESGARIECRNVRMVVWRPDHIPREPDAPDDNVELQDQFYLRWPDFESPDDVEPRVPADEWDRWYKGYLPKHYKNCHYGKMSQPKEK